MPIITCYRRQYAVGQGGLHLGIITYPHLNSNNEIVYNNFAYLYDCGCSGKKDLLNKKINNIIAILKNVPNLRYLYVFISHVHDDHIKGLPYLCKKLASSSFSNIHKVIVLPYMSDAEKIIIFGNLSKARVFIDIENNPREYNIDNIYYLNDTPGKDSYNYELERGKYYIPKPDINSANLSHNDIFKFNSLFPYISWIIKPFYNSISDEIKTVIGQELKNRGINIQNFQNTNFTRILRRLYKKYNIDVHASSMCLYSGVHTNINISLQRENGWLHTGDINFIENNEILENFNKHYAQEQDLVRVIQIPHHGSVENSTLDNFNNFRNRKTLFITTQTKTNGHGRPHISDKYKDRAILLTETREDIWTFESPYNVIWTNF